MDAVERAQGRYRARIWARSQSSIAERIKDRSEELALLKMKVRCRYDPEFPRAEQPSLIYDCQKFVHRIDCELTSSLPQIRTAP